MENGFVVVCQNINTLSAPVAGEEVYETREEAFKMAAGLKRLDSYKFDYWVEPKR